MTGLRWLLLALLVAATTAVVAFTVQNSARPVELSLNLGFAAWRLAEPVGASALMWSCFGLGFVTAWLAGLRGRRLLRQRVTRLEQEALLRDVRPGADRPRPG